MELIIKSVEDFKRNAESEVYERKWKWFMAMVGSGCV